MSSAPLAPHLRLFTPDFARRFALITAGLIAAIARIFLCDPSLVPFIIPLYKRLSRASRRCNALMALLAAGRLPRPRREAKRSGVDSDRGALAPRERCRTPTARIPRTEAWLIETLRHEAANYASQLAHLLAEPEAAELLTATPAAGQILRPICRLLGIRHESNPGLAGRISEMRSAEPVPPPDATVLPALPLPDPPARPPPILRPTPRPHVGFPWLPGWQPA